MNSNSRSIYYISDVEDGGDYFVKLLDQDLKVVGTYYGMRAVNVHDQFKVDGKTAISLAKYNEMIKTDDEKAAINAIKILEDELLTSVREQDILEKLIFKVKKAQL